MDKPLQILQLCLPCLNPKDVCMLRCTCCELQDMAVSWRDLSIDFQLDGSSSANCWLEKNIVTMKQLSLTINYEMPRETLQGVMEAGRSLTSLCIFSEHIEELPLLPPNLQQLEVGLPLLQPGRSRLQALPQLPITLRQLRCVHCDALAALPSSLSATAVSVLQCSRCDVLENLPQLPPSLVELRMEWCLDLPQLPALPQGLMRLCMDCCPELVELPTLPTTLRQLEWSGIRLEHMPQLAHTGLTELVCTTCNQLQQLPELPASLETLKVMGLKQVTKLPKLPPSIKKIDVGITPIIELPGPLPHLDALHLWNTPIQRLPALAGCKQLNLADCEQLQQLPMQLPADLLDLICRNCIALQKLPQQLPAVLQALVCRGCSALKQLPQQLPHRLQWLDVSGCTALQQLPELPPRLLILSCEGCSSLRQLPDSRLCRVQDSFK